MKTTTFGINYSSGVLTGLAQGGCDYPSPAGGTTQLLLAAAELLLHIQFS